MVSDVTGLGRGEKMDGDDPFRERADSAGIPRRDRSHADLVLIVRLGGTGERRRRHGFLQGFGGKCRRRDGHGFKAVLQSHFPPIGPDQVARQSPIGLGIDQEHHLTVAQVGYGSQRRFQPVHGKGDMTPVKIAAHQNPARLGIENGIVVGRIGLRLHPFFDPDQGIVQNSQHLRRAAQGVRVLQRLRRPIFQAACRHAGL